VLAVGAHPDDVELGIGGLVHKLTSRGRTVAILDLTRGEMSTRGTPEERAQEAARAADILGVARRENARLPDGALANTPEQRLRVIHSVRLFRPQVLLAPMAGDRHPDHHAAHQLACDAAYLAGLERIDTSQEPYRPPVAYFYHPYYDDAAQPQMIVDVSEDFEAKLKALRAHASQFHNPAYEGAETYISSAGFWESIPVRAAYWGKRIGAAYGEPLCAVRPVAVDLPPGLERTP